MLGAAFGQGAYTITVTPRVDDDILAPCQYELTIPQNGVAAFADKERLALLLARHCRSKDRGDMDVDRVADDFGHVRGTRRAPGVTPCTNRRARAD